MINKLLIENYKIINIYKYIYHIDKYLYQFKSYIIYLY